MHEDDFDRWDQLPPRPHYCQCGAVVPLASSRPCDSCGVAVCLRCYHHLCPHCMHRRATSVEPGRGAYGE